jgi:hypothetical protein
LKPYIKNKMPQSVTEKPTGALAKPVEQKSAEPTAENDGVESESDYFTSD